MNSHPCHLLNQSLLHYIHPDKAKNTNHRQTSLTGTDHCNSKLSKVFSLNSFKSIKVFLKVYTCFFFQYFRKAETIVFSQNLILL